MGGFETLTFRDLNILLFISVYQLLALDEDLFGTRAIEDAGDRGNACNFAKRNGKRRNSESNNYASAQREPHRDKLFITLRFLYTVPSRNHSIWNKWVNTNMGPHGSGLLFRVSNGEGTDPL